MTSRIQQKNYVPLDKAGSRLDQVAAEMFPNYSRSKLKVWLESGELLVNGLKVKPNMRLCGGEKLELDALLEEEGNWEAEDIPLEILYEDDQLMVINKPVNLVVHPAAGNWTGTLLNGLLNYHACFRALPRSGIVHRLDKDTTGLMVVAKTLESQTNLVEQLQSRSVRRQYLALVWGQVPKNGVVDADIGRHPTSRTKMAVVNRGGKPAITHFSTIESYDDVSLVRLKLETGRTHQIRVHMSHLGFPLVGDLTYGKKISLAERNRFDESLIKLADFPRQALHAEVLGLAHPKTGESCEWQVNPPADFQILLDSLNVY